MNPEVSKDLLLLEAIECFDSLANELVNILATKYNLDLSEQNVLGKLNGLNDSRKNGILNTNWKYNFHGDACQFENLESRQIVDVKWNRNGKFGAITEFYLLKFIQTTKSLNHVNQHFHSLDEINDSINRLLQTNHLEDNMDGAFRTIVLRKRQANMG